MRYFIKLAFNGTPFFGWQIQPEQITVQETLENAFSLILKQEIGITGCGRTDTGVHAKEYFAHFDHPEELNSNQIQNLIYRLNSFLPQEIAIYSIFSVSVNTHARFDATSRTYRYYINIEKDPFTFPFAFRVFEMLNMDLMNKAAQLLLQNNDFTSFSKVNTQVNNFNCKVSDAFWTMENGQLVFEITANRFLRNMVRAIVGTLLLIGKRKLTIEEFQQIMDQKDRCKAGVSVPAHALFLEKVRYDWSLAHG